MKSETGSTIPLIIGLSALLIATVLVLGELESVMVQRQRALSESRFAALFIAQQIGSIPPVIGFDYSPAVLVELPGVASASVKSLDGKTFEARVCETWHSPFGIHADSLVCDSAKARVIA